MKKKHIDVQSLGTSQKEGSAGYGKVHEGKSVISEGS